MAVSRRHAWMPDEIDKLQGVPLPPKVQCDRCRKHMMFTRFSIKQLTDYRYQIKNNVRNPHLPKCQKCAGGHQVVEIECTMCHKTKGMEEFAKSQRNVADTAVCYACTDIQVTRDCVRDERYQDPNKAFVTRDTTVTGHTPDYWQSSASSTTGSFTDNGWNTTNDDNSSESGGGIALSENLRGMSINGSTTQESLIGREYTPVGRGNGGGRSQVTSSWHTKSTNGASMSSKTAASQAGTERSYASTVAERSEFRPGGFAKIPAYRAPSPIRGPPNPMRPDGDAQRETEADTDVWGSEGGDEDEGAGESDSDDSDGDNTVI